MIIINGTDRVALAAHVRMRHMAEWRPTRPALDIRDRDLKLDEAGDPEPV